MRQKGSLRQRGQQRRIDERVWKVNQMKEDGPAGALTKWQRIETDALTIPSESNAEEDNSSF